MESLHFGCAMGSYYLSLAAPSGRRAAPASSHRLPDSILEGGFGTGFSFFAGLEIPMLSRKKPNPLRSESITLTISIPFKLLAVLRPSNFHAAPYATISFAEPSPAT
jgi:hypothetical protein